MLAGDTCEPYSVESGVRLGGGILRRGNGTDNIFSLASLFLPLGRLFVGSRSRDVGPLTLRLVHPFGQGCEVEAALGSLVGR